MIKTIMSAWSGLFASDEAVKMTAQGARTRQSERYPTHARVVLADGQLMYVRHASLAAAKDLLAAQNAIERRQREARVARMLSAASEAAEATR